MGDDTKSCPQCAETVKAEAKLCRYCQYDFVTGQGDPKQMAAAAIPGRRGLPPLVIAGILVLGGLFFLGILAALLMPAVARATRAAKTTACANNLKQLWMLEVTYASTFGGKFKKMPDKTGAEFWLELTRTVPPIVDPQMMDVYQCSFVETHAKCDYLGPAFPLPQLSEADAVGADKPENHGGEEVNVLRKAGDVTQVSTQELQRLMKTLKP